MAARRVPLTLRSQLGDEGTFGLIALLDTEQKLWSEDVLTAAVERFERRLTEDISGLHDVLRTALRDERIALYDGLGAVRQEIAKTRVEFLKWSFLFWVGQVGAVAALLAATLRLFSR